MEESLTAWTSFLAADVQRYAEGAQGARGEAMQQLLRPGMGVLRGCNEGRLGEEGGPEIFHGFMGGF